MMFIINRGLLRWLSRRLPGIIPPRSSILFILSSQIIIRPMSSISFQMQFVSFNKTRCHFKSYHFLITLIRPWLNIRSPSLLIIVGLQIRNSTILLWNKVIVIGCWHWIFLCCSNKWWFFGWKLLFSISLITSFLLSMNKSNLIISCWLLSKLFTMLFLSSWILLIDYILQTIMHSTSSIFFTCFAIIRLILLMYFVW